MTAMVAESTNSTITHRQRKGRGQISFIWTIQIEIDRSHVFIITTNSQTMEVHADNLLVEKLARLRLR